MRYEEIRRPELGARICLATFAPETGTAEWHAMLHIEPRGENFSGQYHRLRQAEDCLLKTVALEGCKPVFKRYFLSDATNERPLMTAPEPCATSYIQQPPLDGSKLVMWLYLQRGTDVTPQADRLGSTLVQHGGYRHLWTMNMLTCDGSCYTQTSKLLEDYEELLADYGMTLEDNCRRTWFFVRDVDTQYRGLVTARWKNFEQHGLTPSTHYIASTGIGGNPADPKAIIQLGCYALDGLKPEQQRYLYAPTHLNRTSNYGVTFERGTLLHFGDRDHAIISGTASINSRGEVMHVGDIEKQTHRMWENVEALLQEADMTMHDAAQIIVYLRDGADYATVSRMFNEKYPVVPTVFTLAPVCRPTWLIEMECIAIKATTASRFSNF